MYPTLYHLFLDLFGIKLELLKLINTFGCLVALAFLAAARCMSSELARMGKLGWLPSVEKEQVPPKPAGWGELLFAGFLAFIVFFKLGGVLLGKYQLAGGTDTQRYLLSGEGHLVAGLVGGAAWLLVRFRMSVQLAREQRQNPPKPEKVTVSPADHTLSITGAAALGGLIGAKVFHWLETPSTIVELFTNPSIGAIFSGLTIYGGLIVGTLAVLRYCRKHGLPFFRVADATTPGLMLAYAVGRLGCQLAGDGDWGIPSTEPPPPALAWLPDWAWAYDYPNNVLGAGVPMAEGGFPGYGTHLVPPVFPTPLYESVAALLIFAVLWAIRKRLTEPLMMSGLYLMFNGFERFWIEKIRVNATYDWGFIQPTQAEVISTVLFLGGAVLLFGRGWLKPKSRQEMTTP